MSHKDKFDASEQNDRWNAFEGQLNRLVPTPPKMDWETVADSISNIDSFAVSDSPSGGLAGSVGDKLVGRRVRFATHALATMVGVGIGAAVMLLMQPVVAPPSNNNLETLAEESTDPAVSVVKESMRNHVPQMSRTAIVEARWRPNYRATVRGEQVTRVWPGNFDLVEVALDRRFYQPRESFNVPIDDLETSNSQSEPLNSLDQPLTAPQLMRQLLNEQTMRTNVAAFNREAS